MKIAKFHLVALLLAPLAVGCSGVEEPLGGVVYPSDNEVAMRLSIAIDDVADMRTTLGEEEESGHRKLYWSEGDRIVINGVESEAVEINEDNARIGSFDFGEVLAYPYSVLYPSSLYKSATTIALPQLQAAATDTFATNTVPLVAYVEEGKSVKLNHLSAIVHIQLRAESGSNFNNAIRKVVFRGNEGEQVSGDFTLDYATSRLTPASTNQSGKSVGVAVTGELSTESVTNIYIVVPAQEYKSGFTVRVLNEKNHYMEKSSGSVTLEAGEIFKMPVLDYHPTHTQFGVEM